MSSQRCIGSTWELITRRLPEITYGEEIKQMLTDGKSPRTFWATAPTGRPHIAYFVPLTKMAEFVKAGIHVSVLFCDLYAFLVNHDTSFEIVRYRTQYYRKLIRAMLTVLGVSKTAVEFVDASSYELTPKFTLDSYKLSTMVDQDEVRATGDEYIKSQRLSLLVCPGLPGLGEEYMNADFQFGGEDQRGLFVFNERVLPQLGYRRRAHMMNAMVPGLVGPKMSSSTKNSKIELLDPPDVVTAKFEVASCPTGEVDGNGVLAMLKYILLPILQFRNENSRSFPGPTAVESNGIIHDRTNGYNDDAQEMANECGSILSTFLVSIDGHSKAYTSYTEIEADFLKGDLTPHALKASTAKATNDLLQPIRKMYFADKDWQEVDRLAYGNISA